MGCQAKTDLVYGLIPNTLDSQHLLGAQNHFGPALAQGNIDCSDNRYYCGGYGIEQSWCTALLNTESCYSDLPPVSAYLGQEFGSGSFLESNRSLYPGTFEEAVPVTPSVLGHQQNITGINYSDISLATDASYTTQPPTDSLPMQLSQDNIAADEGSPSEKKRTPQEFQCGDNCRSNLM